MGWRESARIKTPAFQRAGKLLLIGAGCMAFSNVVQKMAFPKGGKDLMFWTSLGEAAAWGCLIFGTVTFFEMLSERD